MRYTDTEFFYSALPDEIVDESKRSTCNAIIKSKIRSHKNIEAPTELFQCFNAVVRSVEILNDILNTFEVKSDLMGTVRFFKHFKLHADKKIANYNFNVLRDNIREINIENKNEIKNIDSENALIKKINPNTKAGSNLLYIIGTHSKLKNSAETFNFKDLWIAWEAMLNRQEMKVFAKELFYIRYKKSFYFYMFKILNSNLGAFFMYSHVYYWMLEDKDLKRIGLLASNGRISKNNFVKRYKLIEPTVPIEVVKDLINKIDEFNTDNNYFFEKLNKWIDDTIDEVYFERNMEVHSNLQNDLSAVELKHDFLYISRVLFIELVEFTDKRNPDNLGLTLKRITTYKHFIDKHHL